MLIRASSQTFINVTKQKQIVHARNRTMRRNNTVNDAVNFLLPPYSFSNSMLIGQGLNTPHNSIHSYTIMHNSIHHSHNHYYMSSFHCTMDISSIRCGDDGTNLDGVEREQDRLIATRHISNMLLSGRVLLPPCPAVDFS